MTPREFLSSRGIPFEEKNIRSDAETLRDLVEHLGSPATPTVVIGDRVVIGFDPVEYDAALRSFQL